MRVGLQQPWVDTLTAVYCSSERKAIDGAAILGEHLGVALHELGDLGENDRSATGFLPPSEFEQVADAFFASPHLSVRGWETALAAQSRITSAIEQIVSKDGTTGNIAVVSHGAVGTLLYCKLAGEPISRRRDQPANGGGNYFAFPIGSARPDHWWRQFDLLTPET